MAKKTQYQPTGLPGWIKTFVAKAAAALTALHIFSTTNINPNHVTDSGDNVLFKGQIEAQGGGYFGGLTNYTQFSATGNMTFTGSAGFYPRFLTQADEPTAGTGAAQCDTSEVVIWKDSDDNKIYLCFNDGGTVKTVELT